MPKNFQLTNLHLNWGQALFRLEAWTRNPWRRVSLFLIVLLTGFVFGSSLGTINGALALMDPIGAFLIVLLLEILTRIRRHWPSSPEAQIALNLIDLARIGLLYGLILDGFKLL